MKIAVFALLLLIPAALAWHARAQGHGALPAEPVAVCVIEARGQHVEGSVPLRRAHGDFNVFSGRLWLSDDQLLVLTHVPGRPLLIVLQNLRLGSVTELRAAGAAGGFRIRCHSPD